MGAGGQHHVRAFDALLATTTLTRGLHREQQALGAAGGHEAGGIGAALEPVGHDADDLALDATQARERIRVEGVLGAEATVCLLGDRDHVVAGVVGERERPALTPPHVVLLHLVEPSEHVVSRQSGGGE